MAAPIMWWTEPWNTAPVDVTGNWNIWQPVAMIAISVAFAIVSIAYMLGVFFSLDGLKKWAKAEFYQALASTVLVVFLLLMMDIMLNQGVQTMIGGMNPYRKAYSYIDEVLASLHAIYRNVYLVNFPLEFLTTFSFYFNAAGLDFAPFELILSPLVEQLHFQAHVVAIATITAASQKALIHLFYNTGFSLFIPAGVLLRIFPWTRGAGGLLIALGIGLAIVYPIMFTYVALMSENPSEVQNKASQLGNSIGGFNFSDYGACATDFEAATDVATHRALSPELRNASAWILGWVSGVWLKIFFYPMFVLIVTFTFIRTIAPLLGADITEIGQGILKIL